MTPNNQLAEPVAERAELLPCPFCGGTAEIERSGTARTSMIIACTNCGCRMESGDVDGLTKPEQWAWNRRALASPAAISGEGSGAVTIRSAAINEVLDLLTAHELYRYRPKAFNGFIEYARATQPSGKEKGE